MHKRIYVFLDLSLSNPQKLVQGAHLSLESGRQFPCETHPSIIMLALPEGDLDQT